MNPLTVTWAPHMYTNIGHKNFENWIAKVALIISYLPRLVIPTEN